MPNIHVVAWSVRFNTNSTVSTTTDIDAWVLITTPQTGTGHAVTFIVTNHEPYAVQRTGVWPP